MYILHNIHLHWQNIMNYIYNLNLMVNLIRYIIGRWKLYRKEEN